MHKENRKLDEFKNRFLPSFGDGNGGDGDGKGAGPRKPMRKGPRPVNWGTEPDVLDYQVPEHGLNLGKGITVSASAILNPSVRDRKGRPVRAAVEWLTSDTQVVGFSKSNTLVAQAKGTCQIWSQIKGTKIEGPRVLTRVWSVDHVLLTPRTLDIPLGCREQVVAEVTDDEGQRSTDVLLDWMPRTSWLFASTAMVW